MTDRLITHRITLHGSRATCAEASPAADPAFEVLAITAGTGNGWNFQPDVLERSLPLWEGIPCYIDHPREVLSQRSVRDLAGVCANPVWLTQEGGIQLQLRPGGPAAGVLCQTGS